MPKIKSHSGAKKRVKFSGKGKLLRRRAAQNHFLSKKRGSTKRLHSKDQRFDQADQNSVKKMLGR
jgi:large subunit ribosomal protein L35